MKTRQKNISFFDSVGYVFAKHHNYKFLTGDEEFEGPTNVKFVKK